MDTSAASKLFKRAEKGRRRDRSIYSFPASRSPSPSSSKPQSLSLRLQQLQTELAALEIEIADPTNLQVDDESSQANPAELIKGLVEVKSRLEKLAAARETRTRLVTSVLQGAEKIKLATADTAPAEHATSAPDSEPGHEHRHNAKDVSEMDRRVGELEKIVGSSNASLDESSPMPQPLLPLLTRLNTQLTVLTQPRHLDNISRRLKLLLTDLDRVSTGNQQHRRQQSTHPDGGTTAANVGASSSIHEQLTPILTRLMPTLPHIPHILVRLRTLAALHSSASEFQKTLESLEEDQRKLHDALADIDRAVGGVEGSLKENGDVVKKNVEGIEERIQSLAERIDGLAK